MKPLLIIKTGNRVEKVPPAWGDFEDWIIAGTGLPASHFQIVNVVNGAALPAVNACAGVIVTGSPAMVTDRHPWSEATAGWLRDAMDVSLPTLGICYGHQLLAHALGGTVGYHPDGREIGTTSLSLLVEAENDLLMSHLYGQGELPIHVSHSQSVLELPSGCVVLGRNDFEPHQVVRFGDKAWGLQFHPEFNAGIMKAYIEDRIEALRVEGFDIDHLTATVRETPLASSVLRNFTSLIVD
jgi:GMP synthase (glutamine-hydrolysing)